MNEFRTASSFIEVYAQTKQKPVSVAGDLWVVYTDYEGENDTDYLAGGIWVFAPDTATSLADYEFGAFVDGNDPFTSANVMPLTGTATYEGDATGVYSDRNRRQKLFL